VGAYRQVVDGLRGADASVLQVPHQLSMSRRETDADEPEVRALPAVIAFAPGRVNLIGDHTDYTGGFAVPMAIDLGTTVVFHPDADAATIELVSSHEPEPVRIPLAGRHADDADILSADWRRFVVAVAGVVRPRFGGKGTVTTTLPIGAGLSSSASLEIALALALGYDDEPLALARVCQEAEHVAHGVRTGILDQLAITLAEPGHALLLDCATLEGRQVPLPQGLDVIVAHCGVSRRVAGSAYAERRSQCEAAERLVGPLRSASTSEVEGLVDPVLRRRARHVISENARAREFAAALGSNDLGAAGRLMNDSHASLAVDFEVSIPELDELAQRLRSVEGVLGARMTGAGFGGCVVALTGRDSVRLPLPGIDAWRVRPSGAAHRRA
jgi:galactokinase